MWDEVRKSAPDVSAIPVIFVSAETPDRPRAHAAGIAAWLQKPVGVRELAGALTNVCPQRNGFLLG